MKGFATGLALGTVALGSALAQDAQVCATYGTLESHAPPNALTEAERADGWELLFDG